MIVIDASAVLELCLVTPMAAMVEERLDAAGRDLVAPEIVDLEVLQALRRLVHREDITGQRAEAALDVFRHMPIDRFGHGLLHTRIWSLRHNLTAYDAAYFALAELLEAPLWTRDRKFLSVPGHRVRVDIL